MKKANVLQLTIVLIGIILGFLSLQYLLSSLLTLLPWFFGGGYGAGVNMVTPALSIFTIVVLQAVCCWVLIVKSDKLSAFISEKSGLETGFKIISYPNDLLYILLIALGIYLLLTNLTPLLTEIFQRFKNTASRGMFNSQSNERDVKWTYLIVDLILPLILLMFARPIADYFAKKVNDEPITIEETIDTDEKSEINEE